MVEHFRYHERGLDPSQLTTQKESSCSVLSEAVIRDIKTAHIYMYMII